MLNNHFLMKNLIPKLFLAFFVPLLIFGGMDIVFRVAGIGYPTSFLVSATISGQDYWVNNSFYGYRFFSPRIARNPAPIRIAQTKPEGLTRLAVLGESAAMGDPAIEFSLARGLEKMLNDPGKPGKFEVINAAMTAINSPVIVDIAEELANRSVDMFIIYMGNNEVVGPYGPGTAITSGDWGTRLTPWRVRLTRSRFALFLRDLVSGFTGNRQDPQNWGGMEMFEENRIAQDDPRLSSMYRSYEQNLDRIITIAENKGIQVVLCTMAVNLSDSAPFGSTNRTDLSASELRDWNAIYRDGRTAQKEERNDDARTLFRKALDLNDGHAELVYRLGCVESALGNDEESARLFARARDLDIQRFRTDSEINRIIRNTARRYPRVKLADIETAFHSLDDRELFVDHVHFSMRGLYELCRNVYPFIHNHREIPEPVSEEMFGKRLMRTPWSDRKEASFMLARRERLPFTMQWGNRDHIERLNRQVEKANSVIVTSDIAAVESDFKLRGAEYPYDLYYDTQWGHILCVEEKWDLAATALKKATESPGGYTDAHSLAALAQAMNGDPESAAEILIKTGPPYGYYLMDASKLIVETLHAKNKHHEAQQFTKAIFQGAGNFPGRSELARMVKP